MGKLVDHGVRRFLMKCLRTEKTKRPSANDLLDDRFLIEEGKNINYFHLFKIARLR